MIKQKLESVYDRTFGVLRSLVERLAGPFSNRASWIEVIYVLGIVAFMAGFINAVFFPVPNQGLIVYPGGGAQTIPEAVIDTFVILLGGSGIYLTYLSGRQTTRSRMVNIYLAVALFLIFLSIYMGLYINGINGLKG
jgi:heme/copper-type cytochrome/quinol oxidase subunit 3